MNKLPKCKCENCPNYKKTFVPLNNNSMQRYCLKSEQCRNAHIKWANEPKQKKKMWDKEKKEFRENDMNHSDYIQLFQKVFNTFIRMRDKNDACITCGTRANVVYAAGHFHPTTYSYLRFNEDNVHKQCNEHCNRQKRGNLSEYRPALIKKIGVERVDKLDADRHKELKLTIPEIKELIIIYKAKIKQLQ